MVPLLFQRMPLSPTAAVLMVVVPLVLSVPPPLILPPAQLKPFCIVRVLAVLSMPLSNCNAGPAPLKV